jgi:hypothetical protein
MQLQIRGDVRTLAQPLGRAVASAGHAAARGHIVQRLESLGVEAYSGSRFQLPYRYDGQDFTNVIVQLPGLDPALAPVLLGAHYDTFGYLPGADDNAAGVATLLAVCDALSQRRRSRTVVLAFFDAEEPPHFYQPSMGSTRFYEDQRTGPIHCAVILDLVGHDVPIPGLEDLMFVTGMESDQGLEAVLMNCQPGPGVRIVPTLNSYVGDLSDHHVFRANQRPYMLLTCGRWQHYHQATDTPERLNYRKIEAVAHYVANLTEALCVSELSGPFEGYDTTTTELLFLNRTVRPVLGQYGIAVDLDSRADIDRLILLLEREFQL